jgi:hypothetical protein
MGRVSALLLAEETRFLPIAHAFIKEPLKESALFTHERTDMYISPPGVERRVYCTYIFVP